MFSTGPSFKGVKMIPVVFLFLTVADFMKPVHYQYVHLHANGLCIIGLASTHTAFRMKEELLWLISMWGNLTGVDTRSLESIFVNLTHTIKAMEPFFFVVLSAMFLGEFPTIWVLSSLVPTVGGMGLTSMTEASFNWIGYWSAMTSNLTNQSRNVLIKKFMVRKEWKSLPGILINI